jgi:hypothetical protein
MRKMVALVNNLDGACDLDTPLDGSHLLSLLGGSMGDTG